MGGVKGGSGEGSLNGLKDVGPVSMAKGGAISKRLDGPFSSPSMICQVRRMAWEMKLALNRGGVETLTSKRNIQQNKPVWKYACSLCIDE